MTMNSNPYSELINNFPTLLWNEPNLAQLSEITDLMSKYQETYLEIGSGSGNFLIHTAKLNPKNLYIGIELRYKRCVRTIQKSQKISLKNILIIRQDANLILPNLANETINGIFVNFPDPWDKPRWLKHRIISTKFLDEAYRLLTKQGTLQLKTDHANYYTESKLLIEQSSKFKITNHLEDLHNSDLQQHNVVTEFEELFKAKQQQIYLVLAEK